MEIRQLISHHPNLMGLKREVKISGFTLNLEVQEIEIYYTVIIKGEDGSDIMTVPNAPRWVIDNSYKVTVRTTDMKPVKIKNEETGKEEELKDNAFDNFINILEPFIAVFKSYIQLDDEQNERFNF